MWLCCAVALSGCGFFSGDQWPSLAREGAVGEGPGNSAAQSDGQDKTAGTKAPVALPTDLKALSARLAQHQSDFGRLRADIDGLRDDYRDAAAALGTLSDWNSAQMALSRLNSRVFEFERLRRLLADDIARAAQHLTTPPDTTTAAGAAVQGALARGGALYRDIRAAQADYQAFALAQASRLAALRPDGSLAAAQDQTPDGAPAGPALMVIRFATPDIEFEQDLARVVAAARARVPDIEFDVVLAAPGSRVADETGSETALQRVLRALISLDVTPGRVSRQELAGIKAPEVRIFVR